MPAVAEQVRVPELRFAQFHLNWNCGEFQDIGSGFSAGSTPSRAVAEFFQGDILWVNSGDLNYNIIFDTPQKISIEGRNDANLKLHPVGTFLMAITGLEAAGTRGSCAILGAQATTNQSCMAIAMKSHGNVGFFYQHYLAVGQRYAFRFCQGTKQQSYNAQLVRTLPISYPCREEQDKIAGFLTAVDERIGKLKRKKELLEEYKRGMMQKLFSQEVRFKDEHGRHYPDWAVRRLGDVLEFHSTNSLSRRELAADGQGPYVVHYGDIHVKYPSHFWCSHENVPRAVESNVRGTPCAPGDVLIADASEDYNDIGKAMEVLGTPESGVPLLGGLHVIHARPDRNVFVVGFAGCLLQSASIRKMMMRIAQGASVLGLSSKQLSKISVSLPSRTEQERIAEFLMGLDEKLANLGKRIEKAEEFKRGLLQKMFV